MNLSKLTTEQRNKATMNLDQMEISEILSVINDEDKKVALAVQEAIPQIEIAVKNIYESLSKGGRLFYAGAGTSGRLGVLDASECPPTFMVPAEMVQTVMAGGKQAFFKAVEGAEDDFLQGEEDLKEKGLTSRDAVIGITASGRTPYPMGALNYARSVGAYAISLTCNKNSEISAYADCKIEVEVGPEVLTGSTRMKAATSHKMVLNMISTAVMVKLGKVYENLMVDLYASNEKLKERAKRNVIEITGVTYDQADKILEQTNYEVKPAIVMIKTGQNHQTAKEALAACNGYVRKAIQDIEENAINDKING